MAWDHDYPHNIHTFFVYNSIEYGGFILVESSTFHINLTLLYQLYPLFNLEYEYS